jgi:ankyrin repeat protein
MIDPPIRLRRAVTENNALLARRILRSHPKLVRNPDHAPQGQANSSLHLAASLGHTETCRALLDHDHEEPTPALNETHQTALMVAAANGHTDVVHLLAVHDPTCILRRDARGRDAIMEACRGGHDTCLQILLTVSPDGALAAVQRADVDGNTALHFACSYGHQPVVRTLLAAGADPAVENVWNWTPGAYSATVMSEVYLKSLIAEMGIHMPKPKSSRPMFAPQGVGPLGIPAGGPPVVPSHARVADDES